MFLYIFLLFLCRKINKEVILLIFRILMIIMVDDKVIVKDLELWIE